MHISMTELFDCNYASLIKYYPLFKFGSEQSIYTKIMKAYYQNNTSYLRKISASTSCEFLTEFCLFRLKMITRNFSEEEIEHSFKNEYDGPWKGEINFCKGLALYRIGSFVKAQKYFLVAYKEYKKYEVSKKSLLSLSNAITMEGNINNKNRLLSDYIKLAQRSLELSAIDTYANTCMNIADEFFKIGAVKLAYDYITQCISALQNQPQSHQLNEAQTMLLEILYTLNRNQEADRLLEELSKVGNDETLEALKVIKYRHKQQRDTLINTKKLTPPWKQKYYAKKIGCLGDVSNQLILLLAQGPVDKDSLCIELYHGVDFGDADNRLTTLISRINRCQASLILWDNGKYQLSHNNSVFGKFDDI